MDCASEAHWLQALNVQQTLLRRVTLARQAASEYKALRPPLLQSHTMPTALLF